MNDLYNISIFVSSGLLLALGAMLLFTATDESPLLGNYRRARRAMAGAYLFFAAVNAAEYMLGGPGSDVPLIRVITLTIATSQAFLFTSAMLSLLEVRFPGWRSIFREAAPALLLIAATATIYATCSEACFGIAFWIFAGVYALLLVRYTWLFVHHYRRFRRRMDNFFSDNEADRLRWSAWSFFGALAIGIGALMTSIFMSTAVALSFTVVFDVFYLYFAIRFINYATRFHTIESALETPSTEEISLPGDGETVAAVGKNPTHFDLLEVRIAEWVAEKGFTETGITINALVPLIRTNRHYLSTYINTCKGMTFREWINGLKIEEAKSLMRRCPGITVGEVAQRVGFTDKSNFIRIFTDVTGHSPKAWAKRK